MKPRERNRYLVRDVLDVMPNGLTPSERLILMFLQRHHEKHGKGATQEEIQQGTGVKGRTFTRAWKTLQRRNLIISERLYQLTAAGQEVATLLAG